MADIDCINACDMVSYISTMDLLKDDVSKLYFKFLISAMGSAVVISIYSFVDTIAVGKSESQAGAAAMAVLLPYFAIMSFLAVLSGMGGAVLMSQSFGEGNEKKGRRFFTVSVIIMLVFVAVFWVVSITCKEQLFRLFGANDALMPKVLEYGNLLVYCMPLFVLPNFLGCFIRNDKAPAHVMAAVVTGGIINIVGDIVFVFPLHMGMRGAALATVLGAGAQTLIMFLHFFKKSSHLKFARPAGFARTSGIVLLAGFSAGVLELGTVVISTVMNNQIMKYGTEAHLAVYGVISTIAALFQALFGGVGLAVQPISSSNFGAKQPERIRKTLSLGLICTAVLAAVFTTVCEAAPNGVIGIFMTTTPAVVAATPRMTRLFSLWYLVLGFNVLGVYYLQSISRSRMAMLISILRSFAMSVLFVYTLPLGLEFDGVMLALPISEAIVLAITALYIIYIHRKLFKPIHIANLVYSEEYACPRMNACSADNDE